MDVLVKILTLLILVVRLVKLLLEKFKQPKKESNIMKFRRSLKKSKSRKVFRKTASRTHKKNISTRSMRGGYRL